MTGWEQGYLKKLNEKPGATGVLSFENDYIKVHRIMPIHGAVAAVVIHIAVRSSMRAFPI